MNELPTNSELGTRLKELSDACPPGDFSPDAVLARTQLDVLLFVFRHTIIDALIKQPALSE